MPVLDRHGNAVPAVTIHRIRKAAMHGFSAHQAASYTDPALHTWGARLDSADAAVLPERTQLVSRTRDLIRNDGWASAALQKHLDSVIGAGWRLSAKPDYRALGLDADWAAEFARRVEAEWRLFAGDRRKLIDLTRHSKFSGLLGLAYRHRIMDGEALAIVHWRERGGRYNTCLEIVDPDRLSNPHDRPDMDDLRGGVEIDADGVHVAYHIRRKHPGEFFGFSPRNFQWTRYPRELETGRPVVVHHFERERGHQTRPTPPLAPILKKFRMLTRYDAEELGAAILNAILAAYVISPFDSEMAAEAFSTGATAYQDARQAFHDESRLTLNGTQLPILYPGEDVRFGKAERPGNAYEPFVTAALRNMASAMGISYEQLAMDWSKTNYSSARAALVEVWKFLTARKGAFAPEFVQPFYGAWLEEAIETGLIEVPAGAPSFQEAEAAWTAAKWIGPGRGWIDPVREAQAAQFRMDSAISTLEDECAEQGRDWEETIDQRALEIARFRERGLPPPEWAAGVEAGPLPGEDNQTQEQP